MRPISVWCSNDLSRHGPTPRRFGHAAIDAARAGSTLPATSPARRTTTWSSAELADLHGKEAVPVHLGLCRDDTTLATLGKLLPAVAILPGPATPGVSHAKADQFARETP